MPNFISEDDIEQAMLQKLQHLYGYDVLDCFTQNPDDLDDMSERTSKREVVLPTYLKAALTKLNAENLKKETERATREGLTEDELELFDLIKKKKMTAAETTQVKLAAKSLLEALLAASPKVLVQDWFKDTGTQLKVRDCIEEVLNDCLPEESYDRTLFMQKRDRVFDRVLTHATNHSKWAA